MYAIRSYYGVNIFFEINRQLAVLMNKVADYNVVMEEVHHTQKLDAPSGTAVITSYSIHYTKLYDDNAHYHQQYHELGINVLEDFRPN